MPSYKNMTPEQRAEYQREYQRKRRAAAHATPSGGQQGSPAILPVDEEGTGPIPAEPTTAVRQARKGRHTVDIATHKPSPVHAAPPEAAAHAKSPEPGAVVTHAEGDLPVSTTPGAPNRIAALEQAIADRDEEIARLKRLLAAANARAPQPEFHPVPKTGHVNAISLMDRASFDETPSEPGLDPAPWLTAEAKRQADQRREQDRVRADQERALALQRKMYPARKERG